MAEDPRIRVSRDCRDAAAQALNHAPIGIHTSTELEGWVIVGLALKGKAACAIAIESSRYDGLALLQLLESS